MKAEIIVLTAQIVLRFANHTRLIVQVAFLMTDVNCLICVLNSTGILMVTNAHFIAHRSAVTNKYFVPDQGIQSLVALDQINVKTKDIIDGD